MAMLDFNDSHVAFGHLTDEKLEKAHRVFKLMQLPLAGSIGPKFGRFAFKFNLPFARTIGKKLFDHFCGGQDLEECKKVVAALKNNGVYSILDYSAEGQVQESAYETCLQEILGGIEFARQNPVLSIPFTVFKCTALTSFKMLEKYQRAKANLSNQEQEEWKKFRQRIDKICAAAKEARIAVFIDAEESWIQESIDLIAEEMMQKYNTETAVVFHTVQMYRKDRLLYVNELAKKAHTGSFKIGLKIVRGAYLEKERAYAKSHKIESKVHETKENTDKDFDLCADFCLSQSELIEACIASHNENSISKIANKINPNSDTSSKIWFSQLLGMSDHLTFGLARDGYKSAKYVPYGPLNEVMPYLMRRAEENSSVQGQISRDIELIQKEIHRRKSK